MVATGILPAILTPRDFRRYHMDAWGQMFMVMILMLAAGWVVLAAIVKLAARFWGMKLSLVMAGLLAASAVFVVFILWNIIRVVLWQITGQLY